MLHANNITHLHKITGGPPALSGREAKPKLSNDLTPVTGKLDTGTTALVFDMMATDVSGTLDLWNYGEALDIGKPLRFIHGCSTVCAVRKDIKSHPDKMKSRYRGIVAVARLADPCCVWIR